MISDDLRKKLEAINRGPLTAKGTAPEEGTVPGQRGRSPFPAAPHAFEQSASLEDVVKGRVIGEPERPCLLVERVLAEIFGMERAEALAREFGSVWSKGRYALTDEDRERDWPAIIEAPPTKLLFLDIETCGLASTPVFLIGTMHFEVSSVGGDPCVPPVLAESKEETRGHTRVAPYKTNGTFHLRQYFARDYAEERHVLAHVAEMLPSFDRLVTFNGKSFDWPYIRDRAVYHSVRFADELENLDLLHEARRRWKTVLPNCQLQTLEFHISRRRRTGDIPGSLIPEAYHRFVKTGNARQMADVVHHNALDLITMAELMLFILQGGELVWE